MVRIASRREDAARLIEVRNLRRFLLRTRMRPGSVMHIRNDRRRQQCEGTLKLEGKTEVDEEHQLEGLYLPGAVVCKSTSAPGRWAPGDEAASMAAEIDREQVQADLEAIKDQIDDSIYQKLVRWIDKGEPEYLRLAQEKIDFLTEFHRTTWGQVSLPEEGSGGELDEIV